MIIINNYRVNADLRLFNPLTQEISDSLESTSEQPKIQGFFACLADVQFVLYRQQQLMLLIGDTNCIFDDINISTNTISRLPSQGHEIYFLRHIKVSCHNTIIFESNYNESGPYFEDDYTPMMELEDFDFGLFLEKLSKDKEWSKRLFTEM